MVNISVALCTYNGERFIKKQLSSILEQSKKIDEIVICDDCSTDNTVLIIKEFQKKYPNIIRFYQNDNNVGYIKNFNNCYSLCKGEYIFSCDQDDIWCNNKVERIMNVFDDDVVLVFSNASLIDENDNAYNQSLWDNLNIDFNTICNDISYQKTILDRFVVTGTTIAFRNSFYKKLDIINYNCVHDLLLSYVAPLYGRVVAINEQLTKYRRHDSNVTEIAPLNNHKNLKRSIYTKIKDNLYQIKNNGLYNRFSIYRIIWEPAYHIIKNFNTDYAQNFNDKYQFVYSLDEISKMKKMKRILHFFKFINKIDNRIAYKKYKSIETLPIFKDFVYLLLSK